MTMISVTLRRITLHIKIDFLLAIISRMLRSKCVSSILGRHLDTRRYFIICVVYDICPSKPDLQPGGQIRTDLWLVAWDIVTCENWHWPVRCQQELWWITKTLSVGQRTSYLLLFIVRVLTGLYEGFLSLVLKYFHLPADKLESAYFVIKLRVNYLTIWLF